MTDIITPESIKAQREVGVSNEHKFPTEIIDLPSKGLLYPEDHPLRSGKIELKYIRDTETVKTSIVPVKTSENEYKLGLWVRDAQGRCWNSNFL